MNIVHRASGLSKRVLGCTGTALDTLYNLTGRRVEALHIGATLLHDLVGTDAPAAPAYEAPTAPQNNTTPKAAAPTPEKAPKPTAAPAPEVAVKAAAAPVAKAPKVEPAAKEAKPKAVKSKTAKSKAATPKTAKPKAAKAATAKAAKPKAAKSKTAKPKAAKSAKTNGEISAPIKGYDSLNVKQVEKALATLDKQALQTLLTYEEAHKGRKTVVRLVERSLKSLEA